MCAQRCSGLGRGRPDYTRRVLVDRKPTEVRQRIWQSLRVMGTVTCATLATVTEADVETVRFYMRKLELGGFVRQVGRHFNGVRFEKLMRLVRNTGAQAPRCSRHGVTDLNTGTVYDRTGGQVAAPPRCVHSARRDAARKGPR